MPKNQPYPILYSLRNCPYAMRARIAVFKSKQVIELRDIVLKNKPAQMLTASAKATVPVLVLPEGEVIDESIDIMVWSLSQSDPDNLLLQGAGAKENALDAMLTLIYRFDNEFKTALEAYRCAKRYHETNIDECRQRCEVFIDELEQRLAQQYYLYAQQESLLDIALLPFIRQFAKVERQWYLQSPYKNVRKWLDSYLQSPMFTKVMAKYPLWQEGQDATLFQGKS